MAMAHNGQWEKKNIYERARKWKEKIKQAMDKKKTFLIFLKLKGI
jgi:hypothetical protein